MKVSKEDLSKKFESLSDIELVEIYDEGGLTDIAESAINVELSLGTTGICASLLFLLWSVSAFWFVGRGTPVPFASPTKLVTSSPFKYTRNPIKLAAVLFYFGIGALFDGFVTGLIMSLFPAGRERR